MGNVFVSTMIYPFLGVFTTLLKESIESEGDSQNQKQFDWRLYPVVLIESYFFYTRLKIFRSTKNQLGKKKSLKEDADGSEKTVVVRGNEFQIWKDFFSGN